MAAKSTAAGIFTWGLVLIAAIALLGAVVWLVRRWSFAAAPREADADWSLEHLRQMREDGQISREEFERLKQSVLGRALLSTTHSDSATAEASVRPRPGQVDSIKPPSGERR